MKKSLCPGGARRTASAHATLDLRSRVRARQQTGPALGSGRGDDGENGPLTPAALELDVPAVRLDDRPDDGEAEAPLVVARPRLDPTREALDDAGLLLGLDASPRGADPEPHLVV